MGIDPGVRTGCKIAVVDNTGKVLETATVYPHQPRRDWNGALHLLGGLAKKHNVDLNRIGDGTASRETDKLAAALIKRVVAQKITKIVASEAGDSVNSGSAFCIQGTTGSGCIAARYRLRGVCKFRGRSGKNRPGINRRRTIPARCKPDPTRAFTGVGCGGLRQRGGRGCEHDISGVIVLGVRPHRCRRRQYCRSPRRPRRF